MNILSLIKRQIFGYDIFISYSRKDSLDYAYAIATYFMAEGYECYIDQLSSSTPGNNLPSNIKHAVKRSTSFVLVGTTSAQQSIPIKEEISLFLKGNKNQPIIPISIDQAINVNAIWYDDIKGLALIDDTQNNLIAGTVSKDILDRIENALKFTKKSTKLRLIAIGILILASILTGYAWVQGNNATKANFDKAAALTEKRNAEKLRDEAKNEKEKAVLATTKALELKDRADSLTKIAIADKRKADDLKTAAELKSNSLNKQSKMLQIRIAAMNQLPNDPLIAYRLAIEAYKLSNDQVNRKLILESLSKIDLYYKTVVADFKIEDFKEPYILLSKQDSASGKKSFAIFNMSTTLISASSIKADNAWIIPLENSWRILTKDWVGKDMDAIPTYQLWNEQNKPISDSIYGGRLREIKFINNSKIRLELYKNSKILVWDLNSNSSETISTDGNEDRDLYFYQIYGALDTRTDGVSAAYFEHGLVLIDKDGKILKDSHVRVDFDPSSFFSAAQWSNDDKFLALNYFDRKRLGVWNPLKKEFIWLDPDGWVVNCYSWSLKGHLLAFSGRTENETDVTAEIVDANDPVASRKIIFRGNKPIRSIVFLPGDKDVAICDREGKVSIINVEKGTILGQGYQPDLETLYTTSNAFYSTSNSEFRIWAHKPSPSKYWTFQSTDKRKYRANGAGDSKYQWLGVPYVEQDTIGGIELRNVKTGEVKDLQVEDKESFNLEFTESSRWLILESQKMLRIWDTRTWKCYDFALQKGDRQFISLRIKNDTVYAHALGNDWMNNNSNELDYCISLTKEIPTFIKRISAKKSDNSKYRINRALSDNAISGWDVGNLYKYKSAALNSSPNSGWATYIRCRDEALGASNCDVQFIPIALEKLTSIYEDLLWKPSLKELEKYGLPNLSNRK